MNTRRQWNMNQFGFNNQRHRMQHRNKFQHSQYQDFPANFNRPWNSSVMGFGANGYQSDFRSKRGVNRQQPFRIMNNRGRDRKRNQFRDPMGSRNSSWVLDDDESSYEETQMIDDYMPVVRQDRKPFQRESSLPPVVMRGRIHEPKQSEFFKDQSMMVDFSSLSAKRTSRNDHLSEQTQITWPDSESDPKSVISKRSCPSCEAEHRPEENAETVNLVNEDEPKLITMIWSDESDGEDHCSEKNEKSSSPKGRRMFKHTINSIPLYDVESTIGDEGVFEIKVLHCTFCNIICMNKEKLKAHMKTKYHYKNYKKELEIYEEDTEWENAHEE